MDAGRREHRRSSSINGNFALGYLRRGNSGGIFSEEPKAEDGALHGGAGTTHRRRELPVTSGDSSFASLQKGGGAFPFDPTSPFAAGAGGFVLLAGILAAAVSFTFLYSHLNHRRRSRRLAANHDSLLPLLLRDVSNAEGYAHPAFLVGASGAMGAKWQYELVTVQPGCSVIESHRTRVDDNKVTTREVELKSWLKYPAADETKSQFLAFASTLPSEADAGSSLGTNEYSVIDTPKEEGEVLVVNTTATTAAERLTTDEPRSVEIEAMVVGCVASSLKREEVLGAVVGSLSLMAEIDAAGENGTARCSSQRECATESISDEAQSEDRTDSLSFHGLEVDGSMDSAASEDNGNSDSDGLPSATPLQALGAHHGDRMLLSRSDSDDLDQQDAAKTRTFALEKSGHSLELDVQTNGETNGQILLGVAKCLHVHDQVDSTLDTRNEDAESLPAMNEISPLERKPSCCEHESHSHEVSPCVTGDASTEEVVRAFPKDRDHVETPGVAECDEDLLKSCDSSYVCDQEHLCDNHDISLQRKCHLVKDDIQAALLPSTSRFTFVSKVMSSQLSKEVAALAPCSEPKYEKNDCLEEKTQKTQQICASLVLTDKQGDNACKRKLMTETGPVGIAVVSPMVDAVDETKTVSADRAGQPCTRQKGNAGERPVTKPEPAGLGQSMRSRPVDGAESESHDHPRKQRASTNLIVLLSMVALVLVLSVSGQVPVLQEKNGWIQTYCKTDDFNALCFLKNYGESIRFTDEM